MRYLWIRIDNVILNFIHCVCPIRHSTQMEALKYHLILGKCSCNKNIRVIRKKTVLCKRLVCTILFLWGWSAADYEGVSQEPWGLSHFVILQISVSHWQLLYLLTRGTGKDPSEVHQGYYLMAKRVIAGRSKLRGRVSYHSLSPTICTDCRRLLLGLEIKLRYVTKQQRAPSKGHKTSQVSPFLGKWVTRNYNQFS